MNKMLVERSMEACMLRELPAVFHVIGNASHNSLNGDYILSTIHSEQVFRHCFFSLSLYSFVHILIPVIANII
jgi:enoyl-[acyl-carrier-protein] reductase (NADH)